VRTTVAAAAALEGTARHPDGPEGTMTFEEQKRAGGLRS
jgi:hypothetical protein